MAVAKRANYEEKIQVTVVTVDREKSRVECATRDGAMIWAAVWETGTVFRWPEVGEKWTVRKDVNIWRLVGIVQTELAEVESEAVPKTLEELPEGDTRIIGETVHVNSVSASGTVEAEGLFYDYGVVSTLPTEASFNDICTYKAGTGVYWRLIYTGETTYPWAKIGGPPLRATALGGTVSPTPGFSTAELASPLAVEANFLYGDPIVHQSSNLLTEIQLILRLNEVNEDTIGIVSTTTFMGGAAAGNFKGTLTKGQTARMYWSSNNSGTWAVGPAYLTLDPIRVG